MRSEKYYVGKLRAALEAMGAKVIKHHGGAYSQAGEPDLIGCLRGRPFVVEVKKPGGIVTELQKIRLVEWHKAGAMVFVSIGDDWLDVLAAIERGSRT